ncbi:MAG: histidine phosphatase family protein [Rhodomicrobium sp.]|nr:histidine phosphatase family protein [Rhodomicrobium sp.]
MAQSTGAAPAETEKKPGEIIELAKGGGYILYFRHTQTDEKTKDADLSDMKDCSKQRVLSDKGRANAEKLGKAVAALKIPVEGVVTSQFCRALDTAKLMGYADATVTSDLNNDSGEPLVTKEESERRAKALKELLAKAPPAGKNIVIVGHVPNIRLAAGDDFGTMKEGDLAVFIPKGEAGFEPVGIVKFADLINAAK